MVSYGGYNADRHYRENSRQRDRRGRHWQQNRARLVRDTWNNIGCRSRSAGQSGGRSQNPAFRPNQCRPSTRIDQGLWAIYGVDRSFLNKPSEFSIITKQLIAFDLDGTLAPSKQTIDAEMGMLLAELTQCTTVAVISGGGWPQFESQLVANLPDTAALASLFLMPTSGTRLFRHESSWVTVFEDLFCDDERSMIVAAVSDAAAKLELMAGQHWGERLEDRGSQITWSGLGQQAPLEAKHAWDPDFSKRRSMRDEVAAMLPAFEVRVGGSTSIDITRKGIDKAYGLRRLAEVIGVPTEAMLFLGDAIFPGGNDYAVREAGIDSIAVRDVEETKRVIEGILRWSSSNTPGQPGA